MTFCKRLPFLFLLVFSLPFILVGCQAVKNPVYSPQQKTEIIGGPDVNMFEKGPEMNPTGSPVVNMFEIVPEINPIESPVVNMFETDPVMKLIGKSFDQIKQVLGEPDEQGYCGWMGPHYYMLYQHKEGDIRFCSPETIENKIAVSIILGPKHEVLGVSVGMLFSEIKGILGAPDFGPELGMDNLYYMEYFFGEISQQIPEVFISFSADSMNGPTDDVFIKLGSF